MYTAVRLNSTSHIFYDGAIAGGQGEEYTLGQQLPRTAQDLAWYDCSPLTISTC
jgi:hypothetical protein